MQAVILDGAGGPEVMRLGSAPRPEPQAGEVLVRVLAAGVNRPDVMQRKGLYPPPPGASPLLGLEIAGEVVAVGPQRADAPHGLVPGDRVCALTNGGGYAAFCAVPAGQCLPWPSGYDAVRAASLPETFFTVWSNLFMTAGLKAGDRVLVHGGASGIGTVAIQLARAFGAVPFVTAGTDEKCTLCVSLGAQEAINYRTEDFVERTAALSGGDGMDIILDMIGGSYFERNLRSLAVDGRLVIIALQGGAKAETVPLSGFLTRRLHVTGSALRPRPAAYKAEVARQLREKVWPLLTSGTIKPLIAQLFPLADVADAHALMDSGSHAGKIMLTLSP
ncbi:NAD(P)H-quinone oxidoreductase [Ameyamaea chiangmaiensis]|uniref:NAD(P)H-quinone oxidoreductase n=2 Tax=Ameyamaea chiangmaiensis TaxID=442969 RepID=A0A850P9C1_9PROT|nr:NAD(P)H-quinone oxidoreductase [Ameyamaea chiangmaiensis]MBS4073834.1 NAD(P)H-quinone oxidoreductase [Ameyamaea chiangmaiensis]NVN39170.1 NAD(P)H-quinone oxidoreductase [Ameyamaea chiangmaiensis]